MISLDDPFQAQPEVCLLGDSRTYPIGVLTMTDVKHLLGKSHPAIAFPTDREVSALLFGKDGRGRTKVCADTGAGVHEGKGQKSLVPLSDPPPLPWEQYGGNLAYFSPAWPRKVTSQPCLPVAEILAGK